MTYLGDYIGQLLSEITMARMHSDLEAIRIAELYAGHPLLRHMPVPHFRLPDVQIDVPVVIKELDEPTSGEPPHGAPTLDKLGKTFDEVLTKWLVKKGIKLRPQDKKKLESVLEEKMVDITQPLGVAVDVKRVGDELSRAVLRVLIESGEFFKTEDPAQVKKLEEELKKIVWIEFLKLFKSPPRLHVLVTTKEIREAGPSETITKFQLKICEEAFEWTTIESDGIERDRLVPE